jgi:hypothetical protein
VFRIGFLVALVVGLALLISGCGLSNQVGSGMTDTGGRPPAQGTDALAVPVTEGAASAAPTPGRPTEATQVVVVPTQTPVPTPPNPPTEIPATPTLPPPPTAQPTSQPGPTQEQQRLLDSLENFGPAPELQNEVWLNSEPLRLADLRGKVVMVDFWTFG